MNELGKCEVRRMKLLDLKPAGYNPRKISDKAMSGLETSMERFGLLEPVIWNQRTGNIVGGHQRFRILAEQSEEETDVVVVNLDESEEVALNIALNSKELRGQFTNEAVPLLREMESNLGAAFENLGLLDLHNELAKKLKPAKEPKMNEVDVPSGGEPEPEPEPEDEKEACIKCPECGSKWRMKDNKVTFDSRKIKT